MLKASAVSSKEPPLGDGVEPRDPESERYVVNNREFEVFDGNNLPDNHPLFDEIKVALQRIQQQGQVDFNKSVVRFISANKGSYSKPKSYSITTYRPTDLILPIVCHSTLTNTFTSDPECIYLIMPQNARDPEILEEKIDEALSNSAQLTKRGDCLFYKSNPSQTRNSNENNRLRLRSGEEIREVKLTSEMIKKLLQQNKEIYAKPQKVDKKNLSTCCKRGSPRN